ncbi:TolC family protein [Flectobacillus sp. BAB-3569]|uniref:TolC family protein n=1 Tax=Flectobacillus sp. BAB-3569 TaxID=1509483 RepID=UPI000BA4B059|nr:TolC family protein [Flectobacillus sp. BAB-3569]PAC30329.1 transporter [Flectobacillus sp. BAB-3569]
MKKRLSYIFLATCLPTWMMAQDRVTLSDAVNTALKNSLDIQIAKNALNIATINNNRGVAGALPTVNGSATNTQQVTSLNQELSNGTSTNRPNVAANNTNVNITGTMVLYNGNRIMTTRKRLDELQKLSQTQLNSVIQGILADVMLKYYAVVQQQNFSTTLEKSLEVSKQRLSIIESRRSVGMSNDADLIQAKLDVNSQLQSIQSQKLVIEQAKTDLLRAMTQQTESNIVIQDTILVDAKLDWDALKTSINSHPDIMAADQQITINQFLEKETKARLSPTLNLNAGVSYIRSQNAAGFTLLNQTYGPSLGLNLTVPIYTGSVNSRQVQIAGINTQTARIQKETLIQNYQANATKAWQSYTNALKLLETEKQNYELASNLLKVVMNQFKLGQATIVDVKLAQQSFENSGYRLNNLSYSAKLAEINLKQLAYKLEL